MSDPKQEFWLIIPPCADRDDWVATIKPLAESAGFALVSSTAEASQAASGKALILTPNADEPRQAGAASQNVAVMLSDAGPLLPKIDAASEPAPRHAAVRNASELALRGCTAYPERVFTADALKRGPVEIFPGLKLSGPASAAASDRNRALSEAFSVYAADQSFWGSEIFDINAKVVRHHDGQVVFDLTGRPRILIFGPYIVMPAGRWKAVVRLGFSAPTAKHRYRADWGEQEVYTSYEFHPGRDGLFQLEMEYEWDKPSASEFRLLLLEGAFDGEVTFFGAQITRIG
ncbi:MULTISPECIES: hypothetical protein [unclassified Brevundimonas]|uniref:hypothetical protein n=1 Tax=unclassified Brevundimonas TaxID=2622653 RepID=UPI000CFBA385|nr:MULTISPECIES: hypothetical protein [unclassified Brevundimonas]PRA21253.1 hypothetical protein CQ024_16210 [Brevundimonas sp. MYb27]PRB10220.1 hypothetical protein CQ039_16275 [Brevundimonas sp. MYb52]PRB44168.1 hypothetical protein CQ028_13880 [Brevundimonas sp. MYb33]